MRIIIIFERWRRIEKERERELACLYWVSRVYVRCVRLWCVWVLSLRLNRQMPAWMQLYVVSCASWQRLLWDIHTHIQTREEGWLAASYFSLNLLPSYLEPSRLCVAHLMAKVEQQQHQQHQLARLHNKAQICRRIDVGCNKSKMRIRDKPASQPAS